MDSVAWLTAGFHGTAQQVLHGQPPPRRRSSLESLPQSPSGRHGRIPCAHCFKWSLPAAKWECSLASKAGALSENTRACTSKRNGTDASPSSCRPIHGFQALSHPYFEDAVSERPNIGYYVNVALRFVRDSRAVFLPHPVCCFGWKAHRSSSVGRCTPAARLQHKSQLQFLESASEVLALLFNFCASLPVPFQVFLFSLVFSCLPGCFFSSWRFVTILMR